MQVRTEEIDKAVLDCYRTDKEYHHILYEIVEKLKQDGYKITEYKITTTKETYEYITYRLLLKFESGFVFKRYYDLYPYRLSAITLEKKINQRYCICKLKMRLQKKLKYLTII